MTTSVRNIARQVREERWRALMRDAQDGDNVAYARLLFEILPVLRRVVAYRWPGAPDVEDVVQDILLSIHTVRHTYDPARPFTPWLMTIAIRRTFDAARRRTARSTHETTVDFMPETFSEDDTKTEQSIVEDHEAIRRALAQLSEGQRQAIELTKLQGLSMREASAATGKTVASLKVSVHRAIKAMRQILEQRN